MPTTRRTVNPSQRYTVATPEPTQSPATSTSPHRQVSWLALIGCVFTGVIAKVAIGLLAWTLPFASLLLGLAFIYSILPQDLFSQIKDKYDDLNGRY